MCFSATASFTAAAIIGAIGTVTTVRVVKTGNLAALPYAAIPLLFAAQQLIEGFLWLDIMQPQAGAYRPVLINGFIGTAQVIWPAFAPLSVLLIEPVISRRRLLFVLTGCGFALSVWLLFVLISMPYQATVQEAGIVYKNGYRSAWAVYLVYGIVTMVPFALSTHREVRWFFLAILIGFAVTLLFFTLAYMSVWCFFAALSSALVYAHIARAGARARVCRTRIAE